ncbi:neuropeptide F receptor [Hypomesus transpacificus]|uniref:neuropeptide F receptor n=1 Tax=Hypomesus transpacificus TaxID=137520 RepID=UPI001F0752C7|nr:neuropeptide F receptor [Hypomesus transpacificus]
MGKVALWILGIRIVISILGIIGNTALILFLVQKPIVNLKTFEVLLLGLSVSNLEEIFIVDIYDILVVRVSISQDVWACRSLKFLTVVGQVASIMFTVLISIFRYQKLRDAETRVNLPIFLDNIRYAWAMSGLCVTLALLLAAPTYVMNMDGHMKNITGNQKCPPHFFLCYRDNCPAINRLYKYLFVVLSNLLPLLVVTVSSCLIIKVLLGQKRMVKPGLGAPGSEQEPKRNKSPRIHRSTVAILAAMALFQIDWTLYLVLHLGYSPYDFPAWSELEFLISTAYTTISPYVYGIGNNLLTLKKIRR